MFGIGFGEILIIILITFLLAPGDLPKIIKKIAQFLKDLDRIKEEIIELHDDIEKSIKKEIEKSEKNDNMNKA